MLISDAVSALELLYESNIPAMFWGSCLVGDERVVLDDGSFVKIKDLAKNHLDSLNFSVMQPDGTSKRATRFFKYHNKQIMKISTSDGRILRGTPNHPLMTDNGWVEMRNLAVGDNLKIANNIPSTIKNYAKFSSKTYSRKYGPKFDGKMPEVVDEKLGALMGYLVGDGHISKDGYTTQFIINEEEVDLSKKISGFVHDVFGVETYELKVKPKDRNQQMTHLYINSSDITKNLMCLRSKRVPDCIMSSPDSVVASFLSWLFEADGCVSWSKKQNGCHGYKVSLTSRTQGLLQDVQLLLMRFGIYSTVHGFILSISRRKMQNIYADKIGFQSIKKRLKCSQMYSYNISQFEKCNGHRDGAQYIKIKKVEIEKDLQDVYDIEVPDGHTFLANGIVSHNSGVGKTEVIKEFCKRKGIKEVILHAAQCDGVELQGLPYINQNDGVTSFAPLGYLPENEKFVLFLDELNRGQAPVLQALFQLINDRTIGRKKFNCYVVGACNPNVGDYQVSELDAALVARFAHISITNTSKMVGDYLAEKHGYECPYIAYYQQGQSRTCDEYSVPPIKLSCGRAKEWAINLYKAQQKVNVKESIYFEVLSGILPADEATILQKYIVPISLNSIAEKGSKVYEKFKFKEEEIIATCFSMVEYCKNVLKEDERENLAEFLAWVVQKHRIKDVVFGCMTTILHQAMNLNFANSKARIDVSPDVLLAILKNPKKTYYFNMVKDSMVGTIYKVFSENDLEKEILDMFEKIDVDQIIKDISETEDKE